MTPCKKTAGRKIFRDAAETYIESQRARAAALRAGRRITVRVVAKGAARGAGKAVVLVAAPGFFLYDYMFTDKAAAECVVDAVNPVPIDSATSILLVKEWQRQADNWTNEGWFNVLARRKRMYADPTEAELIEIYLEVLEEAKMKAWDDCEKECGR